MTGKSALKNNKGKPLNVMFGDFCYYNRHTLFDRYTPLAIGQIAQYTKQEFDKDVRVSLFKNAEKFLDQATQNPPDVVAFSVYYWALAQTQYVVDRIRKMLGKNVIIVLGGPCIDSDPQEQKKFLSNVFPSADAIIINEGEITFSNIVRRILENQEHVFKDPIDGASFFDGTNLIQGKPIGLTMDLSKLQSPYLSGLMDDFMHSDYQPLIQTSRFCPYTCAFCVSGKNRGKLRGFPIEQVKEELRYVSKKYADRPYHTMFLADENFGILKRDVEIAEAIKKCKEDFGFPQSLFFYNDKRFTNVSKSVIEILGEINHIGLALALQTENPETLKAINRRNVTNEEIDRAISWASKLGILTTTELIFGMPYETRDSFVSQLNVAINRGFDSVLCHNLFLMDGTELNRPDVRKKYGIKTKFRSLSVCYGKYEGNFIAEHEEVVVGSNSFSYEDFMEIRAFNFLLYAVFSNNFQKWFFHFIRHQGISLLNFFSRFVKPDRDQNWPKKYLRFLDDFKKAVEDELHNTREEMVAKCKKIFEENGNKVGEPSRINIRFGARLIYQENDWVKSVLMRHLKEVMEEDLFYNDKNIASLLINLADRERISLREVGEKEPLDLSFDVINWKKNKFKKPLYNFRMPKKTIRFSLDETQVSKIKGFQKRFSSATDNDFYFEALQFIRPISLILHNLSYDVR